MSLPTSHISRHMRLFEYIRREDAALRKAGDTHRTDAKALSEKDADRLRTIAVKSLQRMARPGL